MSNHFRDVSLVLPTHGHHPPDEADAPRSSALIDLKAYISDHSNATTASCCMRNGLEVQVTLCTVPPPNVSYYCVWCPGKHPTEIATEPTILAAEADLLVLSVARGFEGDVLDLKKNDFFIYQAGGAGRQPSMRLLGPLDPYFRSLYNVGLLRHDVAHTNGNEDQFYLVTLHWTVVFWEFKLYVFNSRTGSWSSRTVSLGREHHHTQFTLYPTKAIALGNGGLMAFVDFWRGIIVCDVFVCDVVDCDASLRLIPLPQSLRSRRILDIRAEIVRIKVADCFQFKCQPDISGSCTKASVRKVSVWSRMVTWEDDWHRDYILSVPDILVDEDTLHLDLLPELKKDDATGRKTLQGLHITRPALSVNNDDMIYLMAKVRTGDKKAWVLAVDMRNKKLKDVGVFRAERTREYPHKKKAGPEMDDTICVPAGSDAGTSMDDEDIDNMDVD
uniref:DUF1618 domain-containing protein n=1 Tax=Leersia perrieri TaxID=77586 RepID=A0A0D9W697_9ORYZ